MVSADAAPMLAALNMRGMSLANNHANDLGPEGLAESARVLAGYIGTRRGIAAGGKYEGQRDSAKQIAIHPTLPSSDMPSSFCASTANSIGSCIITSRQKPLTISATASSALRPRDIA